MSIEINVRVYVNDNGKPKTYEIWKGSHLLKSTEDVLDYNSTITEIFEAGNEVRVKTIDLSSG